MVIFLKPILYNYLINKKNKIFLNKHNLLENQKWLYVFVYIFKILVMLCVILVWRNLVDACGLKPHLFGIGSSPITSNFIIIKLKSY